MTFIADVVLNLQTPKNVVRKISKKSRNIYEKEPGKTLKSNIVNRPKQCWDLNDSNITIFIDHCEANSVGKSLSYWYAKS